MHIKTKEEFADIFEHVSKEEVERGMWKSINAETFMPTLNTKLLNGEIYSYDFTLALDIRKDAETLKRIAHLI